MNQKLLLPVLAIVVLIIAWMAIFGGGLFSGSQENVSIAIVGDVMLGNDVSGVLNGSSSPFGGVSNVTSNVDLLLINFESAATYSDNAVKKDVPLKTEPRFVHFAHGNNNTVAALANNHVCDFGIGGMRDTIETLNKENITYLGVGEDENEAHQNVTQEIKGKTITIFNYIDSNNFKEYGPDEIPYAKALASGVSAYDSNVAKNQISQANESSDLVIVYMHFGEDYSKVPNENQTKIAHELIDYGADVVVGSHPHVVQGIEMYNGRPIFYSLGDFISDISQEDALDGYFVQLDLVGDSCECTVYPVHLTNHVPYFSEINDGNALLNSLSPRCGELQVYNGAGKLSFNLTDGD